MPDRGIGCPTPLIGNRPAPHDFIKYFDFRKPRIIEIVAPLREEGYSISEISAHTGIPRSSVHGAIRAAQKRNRATQAVPFVRWRKGGPRGRRQPPYGYCWYKGKLIEDPKEHPTIQLMITLKRKGKSIAEIVYELNRLQIPSRQGKLWTYGVVKSIVRRTVKNE